MISQDKILDGVSHCIGNAHRMSQDAKLLFEAKRYSSCVSLAVLALEEFGKSYMLQHAHTTRRAITLDVWNKEFKSHNKKLQFIRECYQMIFPQNKEAYEKLDAVLDKLQNEKMRAFYIDWDTKHDEWFFFDKHEQDKEKIASRGIASM